MKLAIRLHLVPRLRMVELYLHSPIHLQSYFFKVANPPDSWKNVALRKINFFFAKYELQ
jgi:hypothetical protein